MTLCREITRKLTFATNNNLPTWRRRHDSKSHLSPRARLFITLLAGASMFGVVTMTTMMALFRVTEVRGNLEHLHIEPSFFDFLGGNRRFMDPAIHGNESERESVWTLIRKAGATVGIPAASWKYVTDSYPIWTFPRPQGLMLSDINNFSKLTNTSGDVFGKGIRQYALYDPENNNFDKLLDDALTIEITDTDELKGGTQIKLILTLEGHGHVIFKPGRFNRSWEANPNYFYFGDYERHNGEIATFHLDRILGFYRAPPVIGRMLNISRDVFRLSKHKTPFNKTWFVSPVGNNCFYGNCKYFCDWSNAICGKPDLIEGAMIIMFPTGKLAPTYWAKSPWRRSYNKDKKAAWETDEDNCENVVLKDIRFKKGRLLLDIIDTHVLDFLIGNLDRHHYEFYKGFSESVNETDTFLLHFDHGRSFGRVKTDELSILTPIIQCCRIRYTTFIKLLTFYVGPIKLSDFMRRSTSRDPLAPILAEGHFEALDRRVGKIMMAIAGCLERGKHVRNVIIDDGF